MKPNRKITKVDIKGNLRIFIKDKFLLGDNSINLNDEDSFLEKGIIDSTGVLELVNFIEETFCIRVEDEELIPDNLDSLNKLSAYIKKKRENVIDIEIIKEIIVLGFTQCSLSTLRCLRELKQKNIRIWSIGEKNGEYPAYFSFISDKKIVFSKNENIVDCLLRIKDQFSSRPLILITSDEYAVEISNRREELHKYYKFMLPSKEIVEKSMEKTRFAKYAIEKNLDIPLSFHVQNESELKKIKYKLKFPFIVKPYLTHSTKVNNEKELEELIKRLNPINYKALIVQEWVKGNDDQIYYCFLLFDRNSNPVASYLAQKLRQWPIAYGTTSLSISIKNEELVRKSIEIFKDLHMIGFCSIEYKEDIKNGKYYIMEPTVGRFNQQIAATMASGVNFPEKLIKLIENQIVDDDQQINGIYWINEINDYLSYKNSENKKYGYLSNYLKNSIRVFFNWNDPLPVIAELFLFRKYK